MTSIYSDTATQLKQLLSVRHAIPRPHLSPQTLIRPTTYAHSSLPSIATMSHAWPGTNLLQID